MSSKADHPFSNDVRILRIRRDDVETFRKKLELERHGLPVRNEIGEQTGVAVSNHAHEPHDANGDLVVPQSGNVSAEALNLTFELSLRHLAKRVVVHTLDFHFEKGQVMAPAVVAHHARCVDLSRQ